MSQISKCPKLRVVLGYWEALGEVSEMRYNNLLYSSSKRSYCSTDQQLENSALIGGVHALVDLVHTAEGHRRQLLQRQHVQGRRHAALSSGLKNNSVDHKKLRHFFRT